MIESTTMCVKSPMAIRIWDPLPFEFKAISTEALLVGWVTQDRTWLRVYGGELGKKIRVLEIK